LGLFQNNRYQPDTRTGGQSSGNLISLGRPNMFLLQNFSGWTQRILQMAFNLYSDRKAEGASDDAARQSALNFLKEAGMDHEVAATLLSQIQQGSLQVEQPIQAVLEALAK
jgi:hypothetical protein